MLTLNAKQVCKCFAGSGPALYKPDLRELGSPAPPGVKMTLLTSESCGCTSETDSIQVPFEASILKYNKCQDSLILFSFHVFLEEEVECLNLKTVCMYCVLLRSILR